VILGFHGKIGAGKNEAAKRLALFSPIPVVEVSYARKLKESVAALFDITLDEIEECKNDESVRVRVGRSEWGASRGMTFREFLQRYGTEAHRDVFGQNFWVDAALPFLGMVPGQFYEDKLYAVTDVRFQNEKERIESLGGVVVRVIGPNEDTGGHASEQVLDCEFVLDNTVRDDDFENLDRELMFLLDSLETADQLARTA
jgi:hypothetical protein